jgi:hypothetical protein
LNIPLHNYLEASTRLESEKRVSEGRALMRNKDPLEIDKARICLSKKDNLSTEHFIELIEKRAEDGYAWERKCRAQGNLKDAERMRKTKEQMLRTIKRLKCPSRKQR